jgi:hypothetical protein
MARWLWIKFRCALIAAMLVDTRKPILNPPKNYLSFITHYLRVSRSFAEPASEPFVHSCFHKKEKLVFLALFFSSVTPSYDPEGLTTSPIG